MRLLALLLTLGLAATTYAQTPTPGQTPASPSVPPFVPAAVGAPRELTLREAEALALKNNPQISIGKLQALVAQQNVRESRSALLPTAFLSVTAVDAHDSSRISAGALNNPVIFARAASGVTVNQLLTDFGRTNNLLKSSEFQAKAQDQLAIATADQILLAVDQVFFNALETRELVNVAQGTLNARQTFVDKIQALANAKLKSDLDLSFANVESARAKLLLLESRNNYQAALSSLSAILGFQDQQNFQPVEELNNLSPPPTEVTPLIQRAIQQRPELQALQDQVQGAQKFSRAEHDLWKPAISAIGTAGIAPVRDDRLSSWYGAAGVNINLPLFNGFQYDARAKAANLQVDLNRQRLADARNNIARDVRIAWQDSQRAFERLSVTKELRDQANLSLSLAQSRYNLGLSSIVEFTQAELQKTEADIEDTDAQYQYRLTQIVLAFTMSEPK